MVIDGLVRLPAEPHAARAAADLLLEDMALAGVHRAVAVASDATLAQLRRAHPGTFAGLGHAGPTPDPAQLEERITAAGIQGVWLADVRSGDVPLLATLRDLGLQAMVAAGADLDRLDAVLADLPGLGVLIEPPTGPRPDPRLDRLARHPAAGALLTSAFLRSAGDPAGGPPAVAAVYHGFSADRLLWASGHPDSREGYLDALAQVDRYLPGLPARARAAIRGGNAAERFSF